MIKNLIEFPIIVGKKDATPKPHIIVGGLEIKGNHAKFE